MDIRDCRPDEEPAARAVAGEAFRTVRHIYRPSPQAISQKKQMDADLPRLIACEEGRILGTVQYEIKDGHLEVFALAVAPALQRRGIARALIERLSVIAAGRGCCVITLWAVVKTGNLTVYERLGFSTVEQRVAPRLMAADGGALDEVRMERRVNPPTGTP